MRFLKFFIKFVLLPVAVICIVLYFASWRVFSQDITYGVSFSKLHADELGVDWKAAYQAALYDLDIKHFRLSAHWPMIEPRDDAFSFEEMDYQISEAEKAGADVILAVGLRTPGWPECHRPEWTLDMERSVLQEKQLSYVREVVNRYKDSPALKYWQVENEAFLHFATQYCEDIDVDFFKKEIALVKELDPAHPIMITDSGEFGRWYKAYRLGDVFATSQYLYVWYNPFGPIRYPIGPGLFTLKRNLMEWFFGEKPAILSELGLEPWLSKPIKDASLEEQFALMNEERFDEAIRFGRKTSFTEQYLWGVEWWYYLKEKHNRPEIWEKARGLYYQNP